jgi:hypothetical protein
MPRVTILPILTLAVVLELAVVAAPQAQDRYGPTAPTSAPASDPASAPNGAPVSAPVSARGRFLSWPGKGAKTLSAPSPGATSQAPARLPAPVRAVAGASRLAQPAYKDLAAYRAAPVRANSGWAPVYIPPSRSVGAAQVAAPVPAAPPSTPTLAGAPQRAPASIYDAAPPRQAAAAATSVPPRPGVAQTAQGDERVHFYSLHRQYGLQPDPAPIPPQFFTNTADMSEPQGPNPIQRLTSGSGAAATTRTVRAADSSDASTGQQ